MDDLRGDFLGPPHGTTPAAVIGNENKVRSFKNSEHIRNTFPEPYLVTTRTNIQRSNRNI